MKLKRLLSKNFYQNVKKYREMKKNKFSILIKTLAGYAIFMFVSMFPFFQISQQYTEDNLDELRIFIFQYLGIIAFLIPLLLVIFYFILNRIFYYKSKKRRKELLSLYGWDHSYFAKIEKELKKANLEELLLLEDIVLNLDHLPQPDQQNIINIYEQQLDFYQNKKTTIQDKINKHKNINKALKEI